ncbi:hypothetical protein [Duganella vulcania]|uniref:Uncharacterized protein n=1 Tax=Duganella vulcania TaxID=2692166 RepID=A0A845GSQ8_9BURK|nr:hypothetical protein [Duganella vulcania]MYM96402.1 hypothetical protein [Duganella vulcania]
MTRYRWLSAEWPVSIATLAKRLKAKPFSSQVRHGFVVDRVRDESLEGRYIERIEYKETVTDPFGVELSFERVEFKKSEFRISISRPGLEIREAPRSFQGLMNQLSEVVDFKVSIASESVSVLEWADKIQYLAKRPIIIDSIQINSLSLKEGVSAKIIVKGEKDVRVACDALTKGRHYLLEKVQLRFVDNISNGFIILGSSGSANLEIDDSSGELLKIVREGLSFLKN